MRNVASASSPDLIKDAAAGLGPIKAEPFG
jgi:hypothetical protein